MSGFNDTMPWRKTFYLWKTHFVVDVRGSSIVPACWPLMRSRSLGKKTTYRMIIDAAVASTMIMLTGLLFQTYLNGILSFAGNAQAKSRHTLCE